MTEALLMLEDGTAFRGESCGSVGETFGELCFNTAAIGYPEIISDPCNAGHIVTMTYPQIGNYGIARADLQRQSLALNGLIVRDICNQPSNFRSDLSLSDLLIEQGVVAISGLDTRALTRKLSSGGTLRAGISTLDLDAKSLLAKVKASPLYSNDNLVQQTQADELLLSVDDPEFHRLIYGDPLTPAYKVIVFDCGIKKGILRSLIDVGCSVELVSWDTPATEVLAKNPDGVVLSNGPGNPQPVEATIQAVRLLLGKVPLFGIGLGHQIIALAAGAQTKKLKYAHRGNNHPVIDLRTKQVGITTQNHGFDVVFESMGPLIPELSGDVAEHPSNTLYWAQKGIAPTVQSAHCGRIQLTQVSLNDGSPEGIAFLDTPVFSVQYHPEASIKPASTNSLFTAFTRLMEGHNDYLHGVSALPCPEEV